jgi:hypothetical protein
MSDHSRETSNPKAPKPVVTSLHSALSMSSPEINQHIKPATPTSKNHKSSSQKQLSSSVDNFFCGVKTCLVCRDEWTPKPTPARRVRTATSSPPDSWGLEQSGPSRRNLFTLRKKLTESANRSNLSSGSSTRSSATGSGRSSQTCLPVPSASPSPPQSLFEIDQSPLLSPSPVHSSSNSSRTHSPPVSNSSPSRSNWSILGTLPHFDSQSTTPNECRRPPSASPQMVRASALGNDSSSPCADDAESRASSESSTLEKHAYCDEPDCLLRKRYIAHTSNLFTAGFSPSPQVSGRSHSTQKSSKTAASSATNIGPP